MMDATIAELTRKNRELCELVIQLSTIILENVVERRELLGLRDSKIDLRSLAALTPVALVDRLREASIRCSEVSRDCGDGDTARALEEISIDLAAEAESLEVLLKIPGAGEQMVKLASPSQQDGVMFLDDLQGHVESLLRLSYACKEEHIAEQMRMIAHALMALAEGNAA